MVSNLTLCHTVFKSFSLFYSNIWRFHIFTKMFSKSSVTDLLYVIYFRQTIVCLSGLVLVVILFMLEVFTWNIYEAGQLNYPCVMNLRIALLFLSHSFVAFSIRRNQTFAFSSTLSFVFSSTGWHGVSVLQLFVCFKWHPLSVLSLIPPIFFGFMHNSGFHG